MLSSQTGQEFSAIILSELLEILDVIRSLHPESRGQSLFPKLLCLLDTRQRRGYMGPFLLESVSHDAELTAPSDNVLTLDAIFYLGNTHVWGDKGLFVKIKTRSD